MTDSISVRRWVAAYRRAWESNDPDEIRALFTEDGDYLTGPFADPWHGHDTIVAKWLEYADAPGDTTFSSTVIGVDGDTGFVEGLTEYPEDNIFANLWVIEFASDGRARRFTEWYMKRPQPDQADSSAS